MTGHDLLTIDAAPRRLHPIEAVLVNAALLRDRHVRICRCTTIIVGYNDVDTFARWNEHRRAVEVLRRG